MGYSLHDIQQQFTSMNIPDVSLASGDVYYFSTIKNIDYGWGCGWRNIQMLFSWLQTSYSKWFESHHYKYDLPDLRKHLLNAWKQGIDVDGCEQIGTRLEGTWIGATEAYTLMTGLMLNVGLVDFDFHNRSSAVEALFLFFKDHFSDSSKSKCHISPCYLQFQGHSITVIGYCSSLKSLVVFDPDAHQSNKKNTSGFQQDTMKRMLVNKRFFRDLQYQVLYMKEDLFLENIQERKQIRSTRISDY
ncbi:ubiquitin-fold modifier-specific protease [Schizosaccharomyces octosporus yFS286]|uniref:Ubiquitin-fold modifier-specific protease n=1 Tax=Schizosaccharomyces octosporus (strain yFS286) TaxID=483514 RepID=S9RG33_SCHOY|nr:ubiquitin-fold modifier-specific protease [Schizosaccharomyces octosporus yFS286]EPX73029.1 ubiquitin-fold modifier-specific protease [Schizosaccharomyces octosporus yFS286]